MKINWLKYKIIYFSLSGFLILISIYSILTWKFNLGVDFTGGAVIEYKFNNDISTEEISRALTDNNIEVTAIQKVGTGNYLFRFGNISDEEIGRFEEILGTKAEFERLQYEKVGPAVGPEMIKKTGYAVTISAIAILLWVALQFKNIRFGVSAILAMLHDSFILVGLFSLLGHFFGAQIDFLFVTALLTTLSFSVHDTIVVYDRVREINKKYGGEFSEVANRALTETMRRSINNSVTIILMLVSLVLFGGTTILWFAVALLIGTVLGTYSSPFVAVPLLVISQKFKYYIK